MGLFVGSPTIRTSSEEFVYSEDPDIKPLLPRELAGCGWIRTALLRQKGAFAIPRGADVVTLRALDPDERTEQRGIANSGLRSLFGVRKGLVKVDCNGTVRSRVDELEVWAGALAQQQGFALDLLAMVCGAMTIGADVDAVHGSARIVLDYEEPKAQEGATDGGPKSTAA